MVGAQGRRHGEGVAHLSGGDGVQQRGEAGAGDNQGLGLVRAKAFHRLQIPRQPADGALVGDGVGQLHAQRLDPDTGLQSGLLGQFAPGPRQGILVERRASLWHLPGEVHQGEPLLADEGDRAVAVQRQDADGQRFGPHDAVAGRGARWGRRRLLRHRHPRILERHPARLGGPRSRSRDAGGPGRIGGPVGGGEGLGGIPGRAAPRC